MKNLKKLFVAAVMLVVALTAVVSSTYAWFTMQNEVDVDQMEKTEKLLEEKGFKTLDVQSLSSM